MKFTCIALLATVAADKTKLNLNNPSTPNSDDVAGSDSNIKTTKWESDHNGVKKSYVSFVDKENKTMVSEMRKKFDDHFEYAFKSKGIKEDDAASMNLPKCSSSQECADSG